MLLYHLYTMECQKRWRTRNVHLYLQLLALFCDTYICSMKDVTKKCEDCTVCHIRSLKSVITGNICPDRHDMIWVDYVLIYIYTCIYIHMIRLHLPLTHYFAVDCGFIHRSLTYPSDLLSFCISTVHQYMEEC